jgi:hypothetical protein
MQATRSCILQTELSSACLLFYAKIPKAPKHYHLELIAIIYFVARIETEPIVPTICRNLQKVEPIGSSSTLVASYGEP